MPDVQFRAMGSDKKRKQSYEKSRFSRIGDGVGCNLGPAVQNARDWSESTGPSDRQAAYTYDSFDSTIAAQPDETDAYRYHGGPKYND